MVEPDQKSSSGKIIHICDGWEKSNGAANIARLIGGEQAAAGYEVAYERFAPAEDLRAADEVWLHCGWMPCLWRAAKIVTDGRTGRRPLLRWMPEACYDPVRLSYSRWKKWIAGLLFERRCLRKCDAIVATCEAERSWIRAYLGEKCPPIEIQDITRFFDLSRTPESPREARGAEPLHVMYLGRPHPLKGCRYLVQAVEEINRTKNCAGNDNLVELHMVSDKFGEDLEREWDWCDVLCLPTLSDNLGLVVAEAIAHGRRVITTDGAPAWREFFASHPDNGIYLVGYRNGDDARRIELLKNALKECIG